MLYFVLAIGSYLLGAVPFGVLTANARGIDLMSVGSGNIGATNVARALGWKLGVLVFVLDILKGTVPVLVAARMPGSADFAVLFGVAAVVGHTFSPFLKFKGGKGIATSLGVLFGTAPLVGAVGFGVFLVFFAATRIVSLSSLVGSIAVLVSAVLFKESWVVLAVFVPLVAFVFVRHKSNIQRLLKGQEPKLIFKNSRKDADGK